MPGAPASLPLAEGVHLEGGELILVEHAAEVCRSLEETEPGVFHTRSQLCTVVRQSRIPLGRISCIAELKLLHAPMGAIRIYDDWGNIWGSLWDKSPAFKRSMRILEADFGPVAPYPAVKTASSLVKLLWAFPGGPSSRLEPLAHEDRPPACTRGLAAWPGLTLAEARQRQPQFLPWGAGANELINGGIARLEADGGLSTACPVGFAGILAAAGARCLLDEAGLYGFLLRNSDIKDVEEFLAQTAPPLKKDSPGYGQLARYRLSKGDDTLLLSAEKSESFPFTGLWRLGLERLRLIRYGEEKPPYPQDSPMLRDGAEALRLAELLPGAELFLSYWKNELPAGEVAVQRALASGAGIIWRNPGSDELCLAMPPRREGEAAGVLALPLERVARFIIQRFLPAKGPGYCEFRVGLDSGEKTILHGCATHDFDALALPLARLSGKNVIFPADCSDA